MASSYNSIRCDCCAGTLEYIKEKKIWRCLYCGNEMLREAEAGARDPALKNVVRQAIRNAACGNLSEALNNLSECEKRDGRYVGTLIARLCVHMFTLITPGACPDGARNSLIGQLKREYDAILEVDEAISSDEEDLYDFMDGDGSLESSSEPFAALLLTFDSMGDTVHRDFVAQFLKAEAIYDRVLNGHLLHYALSNEQLELARAILHNTDNLDCKAALGQMLSHFPDADDKGRLAESLMKESSLTSEDRQMMEDYLSQTGDSLPVRQEIYCSAARAGVPVSMEVVSRFVLDEGGAPDRAAEIVSALCAQSPTDVELYCLVEQIFCRHSAPLALAELRAIAESGIYLAAPPKYLSAMLDRQDLTAQEKEDLFRLGVSFHVDDRGKDVILSHYLSENQDPAQMRMALLPVLLETVSTLSTGAMEHYLLQCTTDGSQKPQVVERLLELSLNKSFFRTLLGRYHQSAPDDPAVKEEIIQRLSGAGLQMDSGELMELICSAAPEEESQTAAFLQRMVENGVRLPSDAVSQYLERAGNGPFQPTLLMLLTTPSSVVRPQALANYVLHAPDQGEDKLHTALELARHTGMPLGSTPCQVVHLGASVTCNLFQAYVLTTQDSGASAHAMAAAMADHVKLNPALQVNGVPVKFKRYILDRREKLSPVTEFLCNEQGVFSFFF